MRLTFTVGRNFQVSRRGRLRKYLTKETLDEILSKVMLII